MYESATVPGPSQGPGGPPSTQQGTQSLDDPCTPSSIEDLVTATPEDLNEATNWVITYYRERRYDDIWGCFIDDFEAWDEATFKRVDRDLARGLRDVLRQRGVFVRRGNVAAALNEALISEDFPVWRDDDLDDDDLPDDDECPEALTPEALTPEALTPNTFVSDEISTSYDDYDDLNNLKEKTPQKAVPYRAYESIVRAPNQAYKSPYESPVKAPNRDLNSLTETNTMGMQIEVIISRPNEAIEWKKRWIWQPGITPR